jgi:serine/threonine protein kinase
VGTLAYAAPESLDARTPPDVRVDVFALGAILYELLAHEPFRTFRARDLGGMLAEALSGASNHRVGATSRHKAALAVASRQAIDASRKSASRIAANSARSSLCSATAGIAAGVDAPVLFEAISRQEIKDSLHANTAELIARGGFGSPTIFVNGDDMYFGNDRLPLVRAAVERALAKAAS